MVRFVGLKIQGIRSVGEDPQIINFLDPLTLIQGENGTGKTTIIESLKYITTGALPSGKMQAFIHNNLVAQKKRVDALVQLEFENIYGKKCTVTKRMNSSIKGEKTTAKSDDFTLTVRDENGRENSISSKVADCNREMLRHLGVSKAVLDNVIFCHQEESCWPLGEPKDLKTKFDEIFEVSKYVKAMENFKKLGREYETSIKIIDAELPHLMENRSEFLKNLCDFNKYKENKNNLVVGIGNVENENKNLQDKLIIVQEKRKKIEDSEKEIIDLNTRKVMLKKQIDDLPLVEVYEGVKENLLEEIEHLSTRTNYNNIESARSRIMNDYENVESELIKYNEHCVEINKRIKNMEDNKRKLSDLKTEKSSIWSKIVADNNICKKEGDNEIECLNFLKNHWTIESSNYKSSKRKILKKLQEDYNVDQLKLVETKNLLSHISKTKMEKENELKMTETNIQLLQNSQKDIIEQTSQINEKQKELDSIYQEDANKIDNVFENKKMIEHAIEIFKGLKDFLDKKISKTKEFEFELTECREFFESILGNNFIYGELYKNMKEKIVSYEIEIKEKEKLRKEIAIHLNDYDKRISAHDAIYKKYTEELENYKKELEDIFPDDIDIVKKTVIIEQNIEDTQNKINLIEGFNMVYKNWLEEIENFKSCPLCKSDFQSEFHVKTLENELNDKLGSSPNELEQLKKSLHDNNAILKKLKKAGDLHEKYNNLKLYELPKKQEIIELTNKEKEKYLEDLKLVDNSINKLKDKIENMKKYECKAIKLDKLSESCDELSSKANDFVRKALTVPLPEGISSLELQEEYNVSFIEEKLSQLVQELESLKSYISYINDINQRKNNLIEEIQILTKQQIVNLESGQKIVLMKEKSDSLTVELENLNKEYQNLVIQIPDLEVKNANNRLEIEKIEKELIEHESSISKKLIRLDNDIEVLENKNKIIDELEGKINFSLSNQLINELNEINEKIKSFEYLKVDLKEKLLLLDKEKDILVTKQCQLNTLNAKDELNELERRISAHEYRKELKDKIIDEENNINNEIAKTAVEISSMKGELKETEKRLEELSRILNNSKYCEAEKNLRQKLLRKILLKKTIKDLTLCQKALDESIIKFHENKMKEINITLCELWKKVYTGNDIELIKIKSKPMSSVGDKRKSYDYAVVMLIDGNEIEMRDRCSAGQKMLASILIRIALCEVFCHQCPIIALDEPTTNLDVNKVENIAEMLTDLVSYRMNGLPSKPNDDCCVEERIKMEESWANSSRVSRNFSNFQLIVITHDIQLTQLLYRNFKPEYIYQLRKENDGTSRIRAYKTIE